MSAPAPAPTSRWILPPASWQELLIPVLLRQTLTKGITSSKRKSIKEFFPRPLSMETWDSHPQGKLSSVFWMLLSISLKDNAGTEDYKSVLIKVTEGCHNPPQSHSLSWGTNPLDSGCPSRYGDTYHQHSQVGGEVLVRRKAEQRALGFKSPTIDFALTLLLFVLQNLQKSPVNEQPICLHQLQPVPFCLWQFHLLCSLSMGPG